MQIWSPVMPHTAWIDAVRDGRYGDSLVFTPGQSPLAGERKAENPEAAAEESKRPAEGGEETKG
jgi:hypothetical protein